FSLRPGHGRKSSGARAGDRVALTRKGEQSGQGDRRHGDPPPAAKRAREAPKHRPGSETEQRHHGEEIAPAGRAEKPSDQENERDEEQRTLQAQSPSGEKKNWKRNPERGREHVFGTDEDSLIEGEPIPKPHEVQERAATLAAKIVQ